MPRRQRHLAFSDCRCHALLGARIDFRGAVRREDRDLCRPSGGGGQLRKAFAPALQVVGDAVQPLGDLADPPVGTSYLSLRLGGVQLQLVGVIKNESSDTTQDAGIPVPFGDIRGLEARIEGLGLARPRSQGIVERARDRPLGNLSGAVACPGIGRADLGKWRELGPELSAEVAHRATARCCARRAWASESV